MKIFALLIIFLICITSALAKETTPAIQDKGFMDSVQDFFGMGSLDRAEKNLELADKKVQEMELLLKKGEKVEKSVEEFKSHLRLSIEFAVKAKNQGTDISQFLNKLNQTKLKFQELKKVTTVTKNPNLIKKPSLKETTVVSAIKQEGKKEGEVTRPQTSGSCTKAYVCKINCGKDIIDNCNHDSANHLYNFLSCRGACIGYVLFYGCSMEAGCDSSCWNIYENNCGPEAYEACVDKCDHDFGC